MRLGQIAKLIILISGLLTTACSYQWREIDHQLDGKALFDQNLSVIMQGASGANSSLFADLVNQPNSNIYYADSLGGFGTPQSVVSVIDMTPFGLPFEYTPYQLRSASVAFVDGYDSNNQRSFALMVDLETTDGVKAKKFFRATNSVFADNDFAVVMADDSGSETLVLRSFDMSDSYEDEFAGNIQLKIEMIHSDGFQEEIGKFSMLAGFGR